MSDQEPQSQADRTPPVDLAGYIAESGLSDQGSEFRLQTRAMIEGWTDEQLIGASNQANGKIGEAARAMRPWETIGDEASRMLQERRDFAYQEWKKAHPEEYQKAMEGFKPPKQSVGERAATRVFKIVTLGAFSDEVPS